MISYSDFIKSSQFFIENEKRSGNSWEEIGLTNNSNTTEYGYYLIKKRCCLNLPLKHKPIIIQDENTGSLEDMEYIMPEDPHCSNNDLFETYLTEYHIVYSIGFQVPILYFNIWDRTGKLLSLTKVWDILSQKNPEILKEKWQTITQGDHPIEGKPFYYFHPCNTEQVMHFMKSGNNMRDNIKYYIPNWLNIYGSCFGLSFSPEYVCSETQ